MSFAFAVAKDAVRTTVQSYVPGSGSLTVASGTGQLFPVPTPTAPILFTVITTATYATYPENYATYQATGIGGDTLTGLTLISGIDNAWGVGAIVEMRTCAKHLNDLAAQSGTGGGGGGTGTVTGVSVATANGFAGTVATPSTTPAITIKTTVNGMTKGNGTALVPATPTDYQVPIQFSTSGTSGPATFNSSTGALNIPVYPGGSGGGGSGTVGSGTAGQLAGYVASGTAVSGVNTGVTINQHTVAPVVLSGTSGTQTLDLSTGDLFTLPGAMTGNITLALANPPTSGLTQTFRFLAKQAASGGPFSLSYPGAVVWVGSSTAPDMTKVAANQTMELVFTYVSSSLILGHYPGTTNTDPPAGGSGTVGSGATNQLGYYAAAGTTLSPLTLGTNLSIASGQLNAATGSSSTITEVSQTASFTAAANGFYAISGSANVTATLPTAAGIAGQTVRVRCVPGYTGLCTITGTGGQTIASNTSRRIYAGESPLLQSDGANWVRVGGLLIPCRAKIFLSTTQTIPGSGVDTKILFDTVAYDNTGLMAIATGNSITVPRTSNYMLTLKVNAIPAEPIQQIYMLIDKNGTPLEQSAFYFSPTANTVVTWGTTATIPLTASDILTASVNLSTGTIIYGNSSYPSGANAITTLEAVEMLSW